VSEKLRRIMTSLWICIPGCKSFSKKDCGPKGPCNRSWKICKKALYSSALQPFLLLCTLKDIL